MSNTETSLNALHKEVLADSIERLMPKSRLLLDLAKFKEGESNGKYFRQPVQLTHEHGFATGTGAFALGTTVAAVYDDAQVDSNMVVLRSSITYEAAQRMTTSKKAFLTGAETLYTAMMESLVHRAEVLGRYGRSGLGVVESNTSGALVITAASWAPGIWQALEGCVIEAFTAVTGGSQHNGDLTITAVDVETRTVTVSGTSAAVVANDVLFFKGFRGTEMYGLDYIETNTGSLYGIDAAAYSLWKANTLSAGSAQLTMSKLLQAAGKIASRGCKEEIVALVSNATWENLNSDQAALRRYQGESTKKGESGFEEIAFHAQTGVIRVIADTMTKQGESHVFAPKRIKRLGSTDITFKRPGRSDDQVWLELPSNAGYEVRAMFSFNMFCERPAYMCKVTGIVNA
jgi:hypothetical protein